MVRCSGLLCRVISRGWFHGRLAAGPGAEVTASWRSCLPSGDARAETEHGETGQVLGGGEQVEVGVDFSFAADARSSSAVLASHHVAELAFDFGPGAPIVGGPFGVLLLLAGVGEALFVGTDSYGAPALGVGALGSQGGVGGGTGGVGGALP